MFFAVFLAPFVKISTIRNYVSGVRSLHVERNGYVLWEGGLRLPQLLKGIARKYPSLVRKRAPVTLEVLWEWFQLLDLKKNLHMELWVAILLAFFGLMRKSEFAVPVGVEFDPRWHLSRGSVVFVFDASGNKTGMKIFLARAKCDQEGKGIWIHFAFVGGWLCPVSWLALMLKRRPNGRRLEPLFMSSSGRGMSTVQFSNAVQALAVLSPACEGADVTAHSLRIGGAMVLFEAGASDSVIMMLGRWKGDSFRAYLRSSSAVVMRWNRVMAAGGVVSVGDPGRPHSSLVSSVGAPSSVCRPHSSLVSSVGAPSSVWGGAAAKLESGLEPGGVAAASTNGIPPAMSPSTSEIIRQWLGGICHPLLSPDSREKERLARGRVRSAARERGMRAAAR
jgi:hypothetical protein